MDSAGYYPCGSEQAENDPSAFPEEELAGRIRKTSAELYQRLSRHPTNEEIARELCIPVQEVSEILISSGAVSSLDLQIDDNESMSLKDVLPDRTFCPEDQFMKEYTRECVFNILDGLKENERDIMIKRYNLDNSGKSATLKTIGQQYGVSAETIRQVELRVLRKLQARSRELQEMIYN